MSTEIDAGTAPPPQEIVVFEPSGDRLAGEDPWIAPLVRASSRRTRSLVLWSLPLLALCVYVLLASRERWGIALPAVLALFFAVRFLSGVYGWYQSSPRSRERLLATSFRKISLAEGDLLATKQTVYLRLSRDQWFRFRPSSVYVPLLARRRYVWALGPDSSGRAIVILPGVVRAIARRVDGAPSTKAQPVASVAARTETPKDDPVVRACVRFNWRYMLTHTAPNLAVAGWLAASYVPALFGTYHPTDQLFGVATLYGLSLALFLLSTAVVALARVRRMAHAAHAVAWTPLRVTFDRPLRQGVAFLSATGRGSLPDGTIRSVNLQKVSADLVAASQASGVLWLAGEPTKGSNAVGVPGYPLLGLAKLGPARKP